MSHDGSEVYEFDAIGRHIQTRNTLNGEFVYQFAYRPEGDLTRIQDGDGNVTIIERDSRGVASAIIETTDPRFSMQAPLVSSAMIQTPSGLTSTVTSSHAITAGLSSKSCNADRHSGSQRQSAQLD